MPWQTPRLAWQLLNRQSWGRGRPQSPLRSWLKRGKPLNIVCLFKFLMKSWLTWMREVLTLSVLGYGTVSSASPVISTRFPVGMHAMFTKRSWWSAASTALILILTGTSYSASWRPIVIIATYIIKVSSLSTKWRAKVLVCTSPKSSPKIIRISGLCFTKSSCEDFG